jgi:hypothetical protein
LRSSRHSSRYSSRYPSSNSKAKWVIALVVVVVLLVAVVAAAFFMFREEPDALPFAGGGEQPSGVSGVIAPTPTKVAEKSVQSAAAQPTDTPHPTTTLIPTTIPVMASAPIRISTSTSVPPTLAQIPTTTARPAATARPTAPSSGLTPLPEKNTQEMPHVFVGLIAVSGVAAADGTEVTVWVTEYDGPIGTAITADGAYTVFANQYGLASFDGNDLIFKVNGQETGETANWVRGGATILDLSLD